MPAFAQLYDNFVIDYTDLERYDMALDAIEEGADPEATFLDYYSGGGTGIKLWLGRADVTPERAAAFMARRVSEHPDWARMPYGYASTLQKQVMTAGFPKKSVPCSSDYATHWKYPLLTLRQSSWNYSREKA